MILPGQQIWSLPDIASRVSATGCVLFMYYSTANPTTSNSDCINNVKASKNANSIQASAVDVFSKAKLFTHWHNVIMNHRMMMTKHWHSEAQPDPVGKYVARSKKAPVK